MENLKKQFILALSLVFIVSSCSVEKRHYMKGYHVVWTKHKKLTIPSKKNMEPSFIPREEIAQLDFADPKTDTILIASTMKIPVTPATNKKPKSLPDLKKQKNIPQRTEQTFIKDHNKKRTNGYQDSLLYAIGGSLSLLTFGLFRSKYKTAKKLSRWGKKNKWKTRGLLAGINSVLAGGGLYAGKLLFDEGILVSEQTTTVLLGTSVLTALLYPMKNSVLNLFDFSYLTQKTHHLILTSSCFLLMTGIGNQYAANKDFNSSLTPTLNFIDSKIPDDLSFHHKAKQVDTANKTLQLKPDEEGATTAVKVLGTVFSIILFVLLEALVLVLSCVIACNGQDGLALLTLILGTGVCVFILVMLLKGIWKKDAQVHSPVT